MKIVVAMDSFKGSLSANEACEIVAKTIGLPPKNWSSFSESIIDLCGILFNPKKGDCTDKKVSRSYVKSHSPQPQGE
jgi:hypothetical protein